MAEEKSRILRVLEALSQCVDPAKPADIGSMIEETPFNTGHDLFELEKSGLAEKPDKEKSLYLITDRGRETLENPPDKWLYESRRETPPPGPPPRAPSGVPLGALPEEITVPSQADLFRGIGERLGVGARKGDIRLDAIIYYVQRTADLDNLSKVWNALTEMGVANDVKKRWIKLYAQNLPSKEIPEELKEKLEAGLEPDKVKVEAEIPPKPKRFSVVGGEIIGDLEGDYNFKEALQYVAQQRGVPAEQASPLAAMVEAMKLGPEMATATLTTMIPLITKEPQKTEATLSQTLQTLKDIGAFGKEGGGILETIQALKELGLVGKTSEGESSLLDQLAKLGDLGLLRKPGEGEGAASETVRALEAQLKQLTEELRTKEIEGLKGSMGALASQLTDLRNQMATQGRLEGRYAILDKGLGTLDTQLTGVRTDLKGALDTITQAGVPGPRAKSAEERARITKSLKGAVKLEQRAHELEDELLFGSSKG